MFDLKVFDGCDSYFYGTQLRIDWGEYPLVVVLGLSYFVCIGLVPCTAGGLKGLVRLMYSSLAEYYTVSLQSFLVPNVLES